MPKYNIITILTNIFSFSPSRLAITLYLLSDALQFTVSLIDPNLPLIYFIYLLAINRWTMLFVFFVICFFYEVRRENKRLKSL